MKTTVASAEASARRLLAVDQHPIVTSGLELLLRSQPDLHFCGAAQTARSAMNQVLAKAPALIVTGLRLPDSNGLEFIKNLTALSPAAILVLSSLDERIHAERVLHAGARGYIMKNADPSDLLRAIRKILSGQIYLSDALSSQFVEAVAGRRNPARFSLSALSDREFEVFCFLGEGSGTREIAKRLRLSIKTIETHRLHIREKLRLTTHAELIKMAFQFASASARPEPPATLSPPLASPLSSSANP